MFVRTEYKLIRRFLPFIRTNKKFNECTVIKVFSNVKDAVDFWKEYKKENGDFFGLTGYEGFYLVNEKDRMVRLFRTTRSKYKPA